MTHGTNFKTGKRVDDPKYRAAVRTFPCEICEEFELVQCSPSEFHHIIHDRMSQAKTSCAFGISLCDCHHKGQRFDRDRTKIAIHNDKEAFRLIYGPDHKYTKRTQDRVKAEFGYTPKGLE